MITYENVTNPTTGKEIVYVHATGFTGDPQYSQYVEGDEHKRNRYTCYLLVNNDETGERTTLRVNFWNGLAGIAQRELSKNIGHLTVRGRLSMYNDLYGVQRFSVNINNESEYDVHRLTPYVAPGSKFMQAKASMEQNVAKKVSDSSEVPF